MYVIEISGLKKRFEEGGFCLDLPEMRVPEGYITGFIGENGAGKTTTLKLMMDMLYPDEGTIRILGLDAHLQGPQVRAQIGYVGSTPGYLAHATLETLKRMHAPFYPNWDEALYRRFCDRFSLDGKKKYKDLSTGKQKQFSICIALSHHPKLLLMDEPTANLDPLARQEILDILTEELQREGVSVFFSTHITSDLDKIADYVQFLHHGRLLIAGEKDRICEGNRVVKGPLHLLTPETEPLFVNLRRSEFGFTGRTGWPDEVFSRLGDEAVYEKPTVEDIFLGYTQAERGH